MFQANKEEQELKLEVQSLLGNHLRLLRMLKGLRQKDIADRCGFSRSSYNLVEKGQRNLTFFSLYKIAVVLDEPLENLTRIVGLDELSKKGH